MPPPNPTEQEMIERGRVAGRRRPRARMGAGDVMGALYPFSLRHKLGAITEPSPWYASADNPRGRPIIPFDMVSVLLHHLAAGDPWLASEPTIDLFVDQDIRILAGPLFVDEDYEIERTVVGPSGSRRTESTWVRTEVFRPGVDSALARMLLNVVSFKDSLPDYEARLARLKAAHP